MITLTSDYLRRQVDKTVAPTFLLSLPTFPSAFCLNRRRKNCSFGCPFKLVHFSRSPKGRRTAKTGALSSSFWMLFEMLPCVHPRNCDPGLLCSELYDREKAASSPPHSSLASSRGRPRPSAPPSPRSPRLRHCQTVRTSRPRRRICVESEESEKNIRQTKSLRLTHPPPAQEIELWNSSSSKPILNSM